MTTCYAAGNPVPLASQPPGLSPEDAAAEVLGWIPTPVYVPGNPAIYGALEASSRYAWDAVAGHWVPQSQLWIWDAGHNVWELVWQRIPALLAPTGLTATLSPTFADPAGYQSTFSWTPNLGPGVSTPDSSYRYKVDYTGTYPDGAAAIPAGSASVIQTATTHSRYWALWGATITAKVQALVLTAYAGPVASAAPFTVPLPPPTSVVIGASNGSGGAVVSWYWPAGGHVVPTFEVQVSTNGGSTWGTAIAAAGLSATITAAIGASVMVRVRAVSAPVTPSLYATVGPQTIAPPPIPAAPTSVVATAAWGGAVAVTVNIGATANLGSIEVQYSMNDGAWTNAGGSPYDWPSGALGPQAIGAGSHIQYRARTRSAVDVTKVSAWVTSNVTGLPAGVTNLRVHSPASGSMDVAWDEPALTWNSSLEVWYYREATTTWTKFATYDTAGGTANVGVTITGLVADEHYLILLRPTAPTFHGTELDLAAWSWTRPVSGTDKMIGPTNCDSWSYATNAWRATDTTQIRVGKFSGGSSWGHQIGCFFYGTQAHDTCRGNAPVRVDLHLVRYGAGGLGGEIELLPCTDAAKGANAPYNRPGPGGVWWNPGTTWPGSGTARDILNTNWDLEQWQLGGYQSLAIRPPGDTDAGSGYSVFYGIAASILSGWLHLRF